MVRGKAYFFVPTVSNLVLHLCIFASYREQVEVKSSFFITSQLLLFSHHKRIKIIILYCKIKVFIKTTRVCIYHTDFDVFMLLLKLLSAKQQSIILVIKRSYNTYTELLICNFSQGYVLLSIYDRFDSKNIVPILL